MKTLLKGALALGVAAAALATPASANHSWGTYHWARTANPATIKLGDNLSSTWKSYLVTTSSDWNQSTVLKNVIVAGSTRPRQCRATTGRVEVCNAAYGSTGWLGIASISISGADHISSGTVKLNDTYFNSGSYNSPEWRNMVSCQEVGHTFGLDHQDEAFDNANLGTCMDYTNLPSTNQHPNAHDYDQLISIYTHLDSSTTVGAAVNSRPAAVAADIGDTPATWGRPVRFRRDGRPDMYMRLDGPGRFTVTHVFWVPGQGPRGR